MIIGLVFRTHKFISSGQTAYTYLQWFTSSALSYTIEYLILALVCFAIASRSRVILEDVLSRKQKIQAMQEQIIFSFANLIESKDNVTGQHVKRTSAYVRLIATELKKAGYYSEELNDSSIEYICMAAPVHDIGKMKIPDSILCKPSSLTDSEFHFMKTHTFRGEEIIQKNYEKTWRMIILSSTLPTWQCTIMKNGMAAVILKDLPAAIFHCVQESWQLPMYLMHW